MTLTTTAHSSHVPDEWNQMRDGVVFLYEGQLAVTESSCAITVTIPFKDLLFDAGTLVNHVKQIFNCYPAMSTTDHRRRCQSISSVYYEWALDSLSWHEANIAHYSVPES